MQFTLGTIFIEDLQFGPRTEVKDKTLYVNKEELTQLLLQDEHLQSVSIEIAHPGESVRIMPVKDVIEPRVKPDQEGGIFPGLVSKMFPAGVGRTHVLKGVSVVTTGRIVGYQEGIIDMQGPGAELTPFSQLHNLVLWRSRLPGHSPPALKRRCGKWACGPPTTSGSGARLDAR